jgi:O-antigen/teichoic acid export membrane protein
MNSTQITTSKRIVSNTLLNIITHVTTAFIGFFLIKFFVGRLGEERYGIWILVGSIFRYREMLSMGLNSSINRYIPVYLAKSQHEKIWEVISTSLFFLIILGLILFLISIVIYYNIDSWFSINIEHVGTAKLLILIVGICFSLVMPLQLWGAVLSGLQRYDIINVTVLVSVLSRTILLIVLMTKGCGLLTMGLVFGISEIVIRVAQLIFSRRLLCKMKFSLKLINFRLLKAMLVYGLNTALYAMGAVIIYKAADIIIGIFIGTKEVSEFAISSAVVILLSQLIQTFSRAIKPAISDLDARDEKSLVYKVAFLSQKYSLIMLIPAGVFFIVMSREFLNIWVGDSIQNPATIKTMSRVLIILTVAHCLRLAQHSNFMVLVGRGKHRIFGFLTIITALLFVVFSVVSLKFFGLGLLAIAWSNFIPVVLISGIALPIYFNWKMKISMKESLHQVWFPALLGTAPAIVIPIVFKSLFVVDSWFDLGSVVILTAVATVIGSWFFSLTEFEKKTFLNLIPEQLRLKLKVFLK